MALLPVALVLLSALLSGLYNLSHQLRLAQTWRPRITTTHAVAIESIQLLLLLVGGAVECFQIRSISRHETFTCHGRRVPAWIAVPLTTSIYIFAIFAVDVADTKIQLGRWRHPVQIQTLLLTRSKLLPWTVKRNRRARRNRPAGSGQQDKRPRQRDIPNPRMSLRRFRSLSQPLTPTILQPIATTTQRRGSLAQPGSVARLVLNFEDEPREMECLDKSHNGNTSQCRLRVAEETSDGSLSIRSPTPTSTPGTDISPTPSNRTATDCSIVKYVPESILGLTTPETAPEKSSTLPKSLETESIKAISNPEPLKKKPAARHTAERAQRRNQRRSR